MSAALVTLAKAKRHLKIAHDLSDLDVADLVADASGLVLKYLKCVGVPDLWNEPVGSPSGTGVPEDVQRATLLVIGELDRNKGASQADVFSPAVLDLLNGYRDPSLA